MKAVVTGAAGFLGSHVVDRLLSDGDSVMGIDNFVTGSRANLAHIPNDLPFRLIEADVSQPWRWAEQLPKTDLIFHLASPASPVDYGNKPLATMEANALGVMYGVELVRKSGGRLLFASTSEAYGEPLEHPQRETYWGNVNPIGVRACYDESKRYGEAYLTSATRSYGVDGRIVRIFNTYGPRMQPGDGRVVPNFCLAALRREPLPLYGDGSQTRSFCYVDDLVDGIVRFAKMPTLEHRLVNLGNPQECSVAELAGLVCDLAGVPLTTVSRPLPQDDPTRRRPNIERARTALGWEPRVSLADGLKATLNYFRRLMDAA